MHMYVNTLQYNNISQQLSYFNGISIHLPTPQLKMNHKIIQTKLFSLSNYFKQVAKKSESVEKEIQNRVLSIQDGKPHVSIAKRLDWISILLKKEGRSYISASYKKSFKELSASYKKSYMNIGANVEIGHFQAQGECSAGLWKQKQFDPHFILDSDSKLSVVSGSIYGGLKNKYLGVHASAQGDVGCVYARAQAVFDKTEQSLDIGVGMAAVRGEASISFKIFGASIRLSGSGSIGSAEASFSYKHSSREWAFGSKLGFIAGLGFKVYVSY